MLKLVSVSFQESRLQIKWLVGLDFFLPHFISAAFCSNICFHLAGEIFPTSLMDRIQLFMTNVIVNLNIFVFVHCWTVKTSNFKTLPWALGKLYWHSSPFDPNYQSTNQKINHHLKLAPLLAKYTRWFWYTTVIWLLCPNQPHQNLVRRWLRLKLLSLCGYLMSSRLYGSHPAKWPIIRWNSHKFH